MYNSRERRKIAAEKHNKALAESKKIKLEEEEEPLTRRQLLKKRNASLLMAYMSGLAMVNIKEDKIDA